MAWIEVHQNLGRHPKLLSLARDLGESRLTSMSRLILLWFWALDVTRDGALRHITGEDIALVMEWGGSPEILENALISNRWLDRNGNDILAIHDWQDYCGRLLAKREQNRLRQQNYRNTHVTPNVTVMSPSRNAATVPYHTVPGNKEKVNKEKEKKREIADSVLMTEVQLGKLIAQFGEEGAKNRIEKLSLYKQSTGKRYKSDYHTILSWERKDKEANVGEHQNNPRPLTPRGKYTRPEDYRRLGQAAGTNTGIAAAVPPS